MNKNRENEFTKLMIGWGEGTPGTDPSVNQMKIYSNWAIASNLSFEEIEERGKNAILREGWFPKLNELFGVDDEALAQEDFQLLDHLVDAFLYPDFVQVGMGVIKQKLRRQGKVYLVPLLQKFGAEIANKFNPTATRAQFLKAHKANTKARMQLSPPKQKKLEGRIEKLTKGIGK